MIKVKKATTRDKEIVLHLLDEFRSFVLQLYNPASALVSKMAVTKGGPIFDHAISSDSGAIFLAQVEDAFVGILTIYLIPQIRKGEYCAEIEEIFVKPEYHGKGVSSMLMAEAVNWAKSKNANSIRLESGQ
jgi:GNAT superfamily N-acetyltransferase